MEIGNIKLPGLPAFKGRIFQKKMPRKKKQEKIDKIIQLLEEILEELKKLNENTDDEKCEEEWRKIIINPDGTWNPEPEKEFTEWRIMILYPDRTWAFPEYF